jgi:hypothetical protein
MITYKVTTLFQPEWNNVFKALFPGKEHDASSTSHDCAYFSFVDQTVTPAELGPLVRVELVTDLSTLP